MILTSNPDATIRFTVSNYVSATQGTMSTKPANPDVDTELVAGSSPRVTKNNNGSFSVSGSTNSGNPLVLQFEVLPAGAYEIKDLIIKNLNNINAGGTEWDTIIFGQGQHDYKVTLRDLARKPSSVASIDYEIYLLIKPKQDPESFPVGDYGLIDPLWTNN